MRVNKFILTFLLIGQLLVIVTCDKEQKVSPQKNLTTKQISTQELIKASFENNLTKVRKAVKGGIDVNSSDEADRTALMLASVEGHFEIVKFLLENKADPNIANKQGRTSLMFAASGPNRETVKLLLINGADPNKTDQIEGWSALMWAAAEGNEEVVLMLLDYDADPNVVDKDNETAYDFAVRNGHSKVAELLQQEGDGL